MKLILHPEDLAICKLQPDAAYPGWLPGQGFCSVTRTAHELSIVCAQRHLPTGQHAEANWRRLEVEGPLDFSEVGILADLSGVLAAANISIFVISTHDTDFLMVKGRHCQRALAALRSVGHEIAEKQTG